MAGQDADALEALYDRHAAAAFAVAYRTVGSRERAEEVCREAFLAVWRSARQYDGRRDDGRTWILTVVRDHAVDHRRRTRAAEAPAEPGPVRGSQASDPKSRSRTAGRLGRPELLGVLSPEQRRVVESAFFDGRTRREIAAELGLPLPAVTEPMDRALVRMRDAAAGRSGVVDRGPAAEPAV